MSSISDNQAQVTLLVDFHRNKAAELIAQMKNATERKSITALAHAMRDFRSHSKDLRTELASAMEELDAADKWFERERERLAKECEGAINTARRR